MAGVASYPRSSAISACFASIDAFSVSLRQWSSLSCRVILRAGGLGRRFHSDISTKNVATISLPSSLPPALHPALPSEGGSHVCLRHAAHVSASWLLQTLHPETRSISAFVRFDGMGLKDSRLRAVQVQLLGALHPFELLLRRGRVGWCHGMSKRIHCAGRSCSCLGGGYTLWKMRPQTKQQR